MSDTLEWIFKERGVLSCLHYIDDFLTMPPQRRNVTRICEALGVPLAVKKLEGPTTVIILLEIELDTFKMEMRLPAEKGKKKKKKIATTPGSH